jgi:EAL domain-containing protein (putative c-di-GMP-specific phosphodiesterase class I)
LHEGSGTSPVQGGSTDNKEIEVAPGDSKTGQQTEWYLEAVADANREWVAAIEHVPFIVGREDDCHLKLIDKWISRRHSEIRISGDHIWIRDLSSTNGTFVNNRKIAQSELLNPGDIISIGTFKFCLQRKQSSTVSAADETCSMDIKDDANRLLSSAPRLRTLLQNRNVTTHFQPILRFPDMAVVAYEILGRVADRELPSDTGKLFEMAEWLGCAPELSSLFREEGLKTGKALPGQPLLFVNTTPLEIYHTEDFLASLEKLQQIAPLNSIVVELNEKAAAITSDLVRIRNSLKRLKMGLAFDDFGAGQARLAELAKAPPDFLKFDISLIRHIHLAPKQLHKMVSTFVKATQELGVAAIAEGIECPEEAETCLRLGFNYAQGFLYGRPLPITEIAVASVTS